MTEELPTLVVLERFDTNRGQHLIVNSPWVIDEISNLKGKFAFLDDKVVKVVAVGRWAVNGKVPVRLGEPIEIMIEGVVPVIRTDKTVTARKAKQARLRRQRGWIQLTVWVPTEAQAETIKRYAQRKRKEASDADDDRSLNGPRKEALKEMLVFLIKAGYPDVAKAYEEIRHG